MPKLKIERKTLIRYAIFAAVATGLYLLYTDDHEAPVLTGFSFEKSDESGLNYEFSGAISDARGVSKAEFYCQDGGATKLVVVVAMSGADRNKTSFGILSRSPVWSGNWKGTSYDLDFSGRAIFPSDTPEINCQWQGILRDSLGNSRTVELQQTSVKPG